jgi:hypothetical protein
LSPGAYLGKALNYYSAYAWLGSGPPERRQWKIVNHGEHRIFYADHRALWADWFDSPPLLRIVREDDCQNTSDLIQSLRKRQVTHVLVNDGELAPQMNSYFRPRFQPTEWILIQEFIGGSKVVHGAYGEVRILKIGKDSQQ